MSSIIILNEVLDIIHTMHIRRQGLFTCSDMEKITNRIDNNNKT